MKPELEPLGGSTRLKRNIRFTAYLVAPPDQPVEALPPNPRGASMGARVD